MIDSSRMPGEAKGLLLFLLKEGNKSDAIRLYQDETGAGRTDARRAVQDLARQHGVIHTEIGFSDIALLALMLGSILLGLALR